MLIDALILYLYAFGSVAPSVAPAAHGQTVTQSQNSGGQRDSDKTGGKLTSVVWGT
jgi:hypothetical protein